jgi:hypothetical protein
MFFSVDMVMRLTSGDSCRANLSVAPGRQVGKTEMSGAEGCYGKLSAGGRPTTESHHSDAKS